MMAKRIPKAIDIRKWEAVGIIEGEECVDLTMGVGNFLDDAAKRRCKFLSDANNLIITMATAKWSRGKLSDTRFRNEPREFPGK